MSNALANIEYRNQGTEDRFEYARRIAAAEEMLPKGVLGIINKGKSDQKQGVVPGKVFLILETARMLGIDPMAGLQGINVIEGSASIAPSLMQALVRKAGHSLRVKTTGTVAGGDITAVATLIRKDDPEPYVVEWTVQDAIYADLVTSYEPDSNGVWTVTSRSKDNGKLNWEKYTRQMLKWRAQAEVVRDGAEEVLLGVHYTPEELGAVVREDGGEDTQTVTQFTDRQDTIIAQIKIAEDKTALTVIWEEFESDDAWPGRVEAAFYEQIGALNIEDADVIDDDSTESAPTETEPSESDEIKAPASESPSEPANASTGRTAPRKPETDEERFDRESREEFARAVAAGEVTP